MSAPTRASETPLLREVRERLARPFADQLTEQLPHTLELLDQQLAAAPQREQWKALRSAMDLLTTARPTLAARIAKEVAARFDAKLDPQDSAFGKTARFSLDTLSLVADEQVREEIAIGNATKRLRDQLGEELFALTQRLASVMAVDSLLDDHNPAFPRVFARGLYDALAQPGADTEGRLAAFAAFGPAMLDVIRDVYQGANKMLVERGVLPDFKRSYGQPTQLPSRTPAAPAAVAAPAGAGFAPGPAHPATTLGSGDGAGYAAARGTARGAGDGDSGTAGGGPLDRVFAAVRARGAMSAEPSGSMGGNTPGVPGGTAGAMNAAGAATQGAAGAQAGMVMIQVRPELVAALRSLETRLSEGTAEGLAAGEAADDAAAVETAPAIYSAEVRRAKRAMSATLTPNDSVVADLVAALFERLLSDRRLPDAAKAQVGRLQLPVFKAVMKDHAFFSDPRHPIRGLIDAIAELGSADPNARVDDCTPEEWIAVAVQNVLDGADEDPETFARERDQLANILERQEEAALAADPEVLALRDRERHLVAMREATLAIAHRVAASDPSNEAAGYLYRRWREVMVHDYLAGGDSSPEWKADVAIVDDILWVVVPRTAVEDRLRLVSLLPSLLQRMKLAFARSGVGLGDASSRVEEMRLLLDEVMRAPLAAAARMRRNPEPEPLPDDYTATLHVSGAVKEEGLMRGAWFEFREPNGEARRARLTWVSPVQGACVFKDLERNKSFPIGIEELRERRRAGTALMVDGPGVAAASVEAALADVAGRDAVGP